MSPILRRCRLALAVIGAIGATGCTALSHEHPGAERWVASWGTAQLALGQAEAIPDHLWQDGTLRQVVRLSLGGSKLRVRISNVFGTEPLLVGAATIGRAVRPGSSEVVAGSLRSLRFGGRETLHIAAGTEVFSDALDMQVAGGTNVALSMHLTAARGRQTGHPGARASSFIAPGQQVGALTLNGARAITRWHQLADVEVSAPAPARAVVAIGDSITDGYGATTDGNNRWTDFLIKRLGAAGAQSIGVINAGIGGGALLRGGIGPPLSSRVDRDVFGRNGVSHAIVLIGVNDLGALRRANADTPEALQTLLNDFKQAHLQILARAHARGICVIGATMPPYMGSGYYKPTAENDAMRLALNAWIRTPNVFDGVADFDLALRDPARPAYLLKKYDTGDGLHPSHAGYAALAEAVPLASLNKCTYNTLPALH
jgi:lysophospholipase L1-like esterase